MSRAGFDNKTRVHAPVAQPTSFFDQGAEGQDERDSLSGSDDGSYIYHESTKGDFDQSDDHSALTSQTLNTDGTPKRPMNAFMIFARRRRPQVSAENQAMRTGEISKILSKEWNNMETSKKQFYQEQARQLKDTFNSKYPDYVYRRRPNNTRRKRKPDAPGQRPADLQQPSLSDDLGYDEAGDSPTDGDDLHSPVVKPDLYRVRPSHDMYPSDHARVRQPASRVSPYSYPSHDSRSTSVQENHGAYDTTAEGDRMIQDRPLGQSIHTQYSYTSAHSNGRAQTQPGSMFDQTSVGSNDNWNLPSSRSSPWLGTAQIQDRNFGSLSAPKAQRVLSPSWHRSTLPSGNALATPPLTLPTLSSPFFPHDSSQPSHTTSPSSYGSNHTQSPGLVDRDFGHHDLSLSPTLTIPAQPYHDRAGLIYVPRQPGGGRGLPPISNYSQLQPPFSPLSNSITQQGYWSKD